MSKKITTTEYEYDAIGNVVKTVVTEEETPQPYNPGLRYPYIITTPTYPAYPYVTYNTGTNATTSGGSIPGVENKEKPNDDLDEPQPFDDY